MAPQCIDHGPMYIKYNQKMDTTGSWPTCGGCPTSFTTADPKYCQGNPWCGGQNAWDLTATVDKGSCGFAGTKTQHQCIRANEIQNTCPTIGGVKGQMIGFTPGDLSQTSGGYNAKTTGFLCQYPNKCWIKNEQGLKELMDATLRQDKRLIMNPQLNNAIAEYCVASDYENRTPENCKFAQNIDDSNYSSTNTCPPIFAYETTAGQLCQEWYGMLSKVSQSPDCVAKLAKGQSCGVEAPFMEAVTELCEQPQNKNSLACSCINGTNSNTKYSNKYYDLFDNISSTGISRATPECWFEPCRPTSEGKIDGGILINPTSFALVSHKDQCPYVPCENIIVEKGDISGSTIDQSIHCGTNPQNVKKLQFDCMNGQCTSENIARNDPTKFVTMNDCLKGCKSTADTFACDQDNSQCVTIEKDLIPSGEFTTIGECQTNCPATMVPRIPPPTMNETLKILMIGLIVIGLIMVGVGIARLMRSKKVSSTGGYLDHHIYD